MTGMARSNRGSRGNPWRIAGWSVVGALLLIPLVAMQVTDEVNWTAFDFVFAAVLLGSVGGAFEFLARKVRSAAGRAGVGLMLLGILLLVWINGAVGIIGTENNDANFLFAGVIAVAVGGAFLARFQPAGLTRAAVAAALAQALVGAIAVVGQLGVDGPIWPWDVVGLTGIFCALWLAAAGLFRLAARATA